MFIASGPFVSSFIATGDDGGGGPSLLMIFLAVLGVLVIATFLAAGPTVVVVERPSVLLPVVFVIAGGLGMLYLFAHVSSGSF